MKIHVPFAGVMPGVKAPGIIVSAAIHKRRDVAKYFFSKGYLVVRDIRECNDLISHKSSVAPDDNGKVTLVPGINNAHGIGVYFADIEESFRGNSGNQVEYVISRSQAEKAGAVFDDDFWPKSVNGLILHVVSKEIVNNNTMYYCVVMDVLDESTTGFGHTHVFKHNNRLTRKSIRMLKNMAKPSKCLGIRYFALGKCVAIAAYGVGVWHILNKNLASSYKWRSLAKFLFGIGGSQSLPYSITKDWNSGVVEYKGDEVFIRPSQHTALFWIVGGMHLREDKNGDLYGEDTYDFHPQKGQNTILGTRIMCWAWSGGESDPTRVPSTIKGISLMSVIKSLFPKLVGRYIKEDNGYLLFSNDLWNALGGRPFITKVKIKRR